VMRQRSALGRLRHGITIFHNLKLLMIDQEVNLHYLR